MSTSQTSKTPRRSQPSIQYRCNLVERASFEFADFVHKEDVPTHSETFQPEKADPESKSTEILTTSELIAAVGHAWDYTSRSLAVLQQKANLSYKISGEKEDILHNVKWQQNGCTSTVPKCSHSDTNLTELRQLNLDILRTTSRMSVLKFNGENTGRYQSLVRNFSGDMTNLLNGPRDGNGISCLGISSGLGLIYGWMSELIPAEAKHPFKTAVSDSEKAGKYFSREIVTPPQNLISEDRGPKIYIDSGSADSYPPSVQSKDLPVANNAKLNLDKKESTSLLSDYYLKVANIDADSCISKAASSILHADYRLKFVASEKDECELRYESANGIEFFPERKEEDNDHHAQEEHTLKIHCLGHDKPQAAVAKEEHAFAGAFSGIFVSLCLHPVDTIKTVIQSYRAEQKSLCYIGKSIVSERGLTGLYRGISSKIASSGPISAIYTFTYESVKGALLPLFPKEYYSITHCIAGGCASIATSFVYTPSERIKQQMQVGSHYHNCWNALVGIITRGGLPSLYAGWGAVLCRNIPHSVVKFYVYENLKVWTLSSLPPGAQLNTLQSLVCGGLAGSTAALFSTPFDVVKTRLQTQCLEGDDCIEPISSCSL
ncbi:uncharacterized protein LOC115746474 isoform X2 [Rhodamnia argentea]|uniref:Uncharacterized protein LOC115746474 isoform X2 n=1 Tax=Rhodamnia argentea TaxID=178133 RepID=A0ABM3H640_9MYRT|nr:uncharacterized protein LOC115746474 isoform X2 [Rhodamnia argentea]